VKRLIRSLVPKPLWTQLRLLRIRHTLKRYKGRRVRHSYGGITLEVDLIDPMGQGWYDHDWPEMPEIRILKQHRLRAGATVFDLVAVEANPHNAAAGKKNVLLNGVRNCTVVHGAVASRSGKIFLNEGMDGQVDDGSGDWGRIEVEAYSIDELAREFRNPAVLFIDVEGYECEVLAGARETLSSYPDCFVEVHVGAGLEKFGGSVEKVLSYFPRTCYELLIGRDGEEFQPYSQDSSILLQRFFLLALSNWSS
jgi:FkbM family methyltransferase